ncbi:unnamed protein product, partial [Meganyctiphanes norvegica]
MSDTYPQSDCLVLEMKAENIMTRRSREMLKILRFCASNKYLLQSISTFNLNISAILRIYYQWINGLPMMVSGTVQLTPPDKNWGFNHFRRKIEAKKAKCPISPCGQKNSITEKIKLHLGSENLVVYYEFVNINSINKRTNVLEIFYRHKQIIIFKNNNAAEIIPVNASELDECSQKHTNTLESEIRDMHDDIRLHKDHYENIYCVVSGYKDFILIPPSDLPWVPYAKFPVAKYKETSPGQFEILEDKESGIVPWICIDPVSPDLISYPQYKHSHPVRCRVHAGDALYLPSLWFHHVSQSHSCIAVNFWYDMEYDIKYNYYKLLQNLTWKEDPD